MRAHAGHTSISDVPELMNTDGVYDQRRLSGRLSDTVALFVIGLTADRAPRIRLREVPRLHRRKFNDIYDVPLCVWLFDSLFQISLVRFIDACVRCTCLE